MLRYLYIEAAEQITSQSVMTAAVASRVCQCVTMFVLVLVLQRDHMKWLVTGVFVVLAIVVVVVVLAAAVLVAVVSVGMKE